jgi:thioredoxin reductase
MSDIAIIGAGPYGLSAAAYFRHKGISFRIFGRPMDSWQSHMPKGMVLKSDGFASNIYDPEHAFTLERFCSERGIPYSDMTPVSLETFSAYGLAFRERMVPELEDKQVVGLDRSSDGFVLRLDNGETANAKRVVLAIGITHFQYTPDSLAHLPPELVSHSFRHHDLAAFKSRSVVVIGGGASALDLAGLLHESGAEVQLVARRTALKFHSMPTGKPRSLWQQIRHPKSGLGPGLRSRFYANAPGLFYYLPENVRLHIVRTSLGPSGGWFIKEKVVGRVPLLLNCTLLHAETQGDKVRLHLRTGDGAEREILTQHVIAATGYRVNMERLQFLSPEIRSRVKVLGGSPVLSPQFESSVPGLYFIGVASTNSFGPVMRFAFGAGFAASSLTRTIAKARSKDPAFIPAPRAMSATK